MKRILSEEHRAKLIASNRRRTQKPRSVEYRTKMSEALCGRVLSEMHRAKIGEASHRRVWSAESRAKVSSSARRRVHSFETRTKISGANCGRAHSLEARAKISAANRSRSPETRAKLSVAASQRGPVSLETRTKMSVSALRRMTDHTHFHKRTKPEMVMASILRQQGIEFEEQFPIERYVVDFYIPGHRTVIEVDGEYWHSFPGQQEKDARRNERLRSLGYAVLRIPASIVLSGRIPDIQTQAQQAQEVV